MKNKAFTPTQKNIFGVSLQGKRGFTLVELLMVIVIMTVITSVSLYFLPEYRKRNALENDVAGLTALIRNARLLSVSSKNASTFGIHLETDGAVLFEGSTYVPGGTEEKVIDFSKQVYMSSYSLSLSSPDIIFSRLKGETSNYGDITLSLKDGSASTTITILKTGVVQ